MLDLTIDLEPLPRAAPILQCCFYIVLSHHLLSFSQLVKSLSSY